MAFIVDEALCQMFPDIQLVVSYGQGLDNETPKPSIQQALKDIQNQLRNTWEYQNPQSHPYINAWRQAFKNIGLSAKKFPSSIEALCRRVLSGGEISNINPFVDFYNSISLKYIVPVGGWDIDDIRGEDIFLRLTKGGEPFTELGQSSPIYAEAGEVSYTDSEELITRHFVWRQSETGKIVTTTKNFFLVSEILPEAGKEVAEKVEKAFVDGLREHFGIEAKSAILNASSLRWDWDLQPSS